jgi:organic radical activating enzyme
MSPKANSEVVVIHGDELKLVVQQKGIEPEMFTDLDFTHFFLQPMDGPYVKEHTEWAMKYCLEHPQWRLSIQTHKLLGIR